VLIAYWDFNDSVGTTGPANLVVDCAPASPPLPVCVGGTLTTNFDVPNNNVTHFTGTSAGVILPTPGTDQNRGLALLGGVGLVNNGRYITIAIDTTGQTGIYMTYATKGSGSGFSNNQVSYSTNGGGSFTDIGAAYTPLSDWALRAVDFGAALDNNANAQIRITFDGATDPLGNNRLDNIKIITGGVPTGACCNAPGGTCTPAQTRAQCVAATGIYLGDGSTCATGCPTYSNIVLNEIRHDQSGFDVDEYVEIAGPSNTSLNGLTYLVIGDGELAQGSGVIETAIDLSGKTILVDGRFFIAADNDTLQVLTVSGAPHFAPDLLTELDYAESDNLTHMIVAGFRGSVDQDLDTNDDCVIDANPPWVSERDRIALVETNNPPFGDTECHYGDFLAVPPTAIGPAVGGFAPAQAYRFDNNLNPKDGAGRPWIVDPNIANPVTSFFPENCDDTPGAVNAKSTGACCSGASCVVRTRQDCINLGHSWQGRNTVCSPNPCVGACCDAAFGCTQVSRSACLATPGNAYMGSGLPCTPDPCPCVMDLTSARNLSWYTPVRLCNVVVTSTTDLVSAQTSKNFMVQDTSGSDGQTAITVFGASAVIDAALSGVSIGDSIDIQGRVINFLGQFELGDGDNAQNGPNAISPYPLIRFSNHGNVGVPAPKVITLADLQDGNPAAELLESEYVQVNCVAFVDGNGTNVFNGPANYTITDGTNYAIFRLSTSALDFQGFLIPTGPVNLRGVFFQFDNITQNPPPYDKGYEILGRGLGFNDPDDMDEGPNCGPTGACCLPGPLCQLGLTAALCAGKGGFYRGDGSTCAAQCPSTDGVVINEIRIDEPTANDPNEYFEIKGPPNVPIGSLTYVVIGDGEVAQGSGVIESFVLLRREVLPASGLLLVANADTYTLTAPATISLDTEFIVFDDDENRTHLLVENFSGAIGNDLDTNDDGVLDSLPWSRVLSSIAVVKNVSSPPVGTEWWYGPTIGPVPGGFAPAHIIRCPGALNDFTIGTFATAGGNDTPGAENDCSAACLFCPGDVNGSTIVDLGDIPAMVNALVGITPNPCADVNVDGKYDGQDIPPFIRLVLAAGNAGTSCLPPNHRDIFKCDTASPPNDCPSGSFTWCVYQVDANQAGISPCVVVGPSGATTLSEGEQFCVKCPAAGNCGALGSKTIFRWVNHDGAGNDCTFQATVTNANCQACFSGKRFGDPPPPPQITLLDWNLLNYSSGRETDYRNVLNAVLPDIVIAQEVSGGTGANNFLTVLNGPGGPGGFSLATFVDDPDTDQALYFKTSKFTQSGHVSLNTTPRTTDRWKLLITGLPTPANDLYIYSMHLKAGNSSPEADERTAAATIIRADGNSLPAGANIIYAGDFNVYTSAEGAYTQLTGSQVDNDGRCFDPIGTPGGWHSNPAYACIHTQSPHLDNAGAPSGATNGGLDDRFDFMLLSNALIDNIGMTYKVGSYKAYGNDCNHYNKDINDSPTIPEGSTIANSLHAASDHLPVVMQLLLPNP
jgi:hypothetical protein